MSETRQYLSLMLQDYEDSEQLWHTLLRAGEHWL